MLRRVEPSLSRYRAGAVALALITALLLVGPASAVACGEEGGEDTGPLINLAQVTPGGFFTYEGGTATVTTEVEDDCGIQQVYAEINSTAGTYWSFQLLPFENINSNSVVYRGEFQVPPNYQEWPVTYSVEISAEDTDGAFATALAGEIEVAGLPPFDEAPYVSEASVVPNVLGGGGGTVKIGVTASDTRGIANAYAIVTYPNGGEKEVWLEPISFSRFESPLKVPANPSATPLSYAVSVFAEDDIGQTTGAYAGTVTVEPKGVPNPGWLTLEPSYRRFGPVKIGEKGWRGVVLENTGKPGSPPVSGFLRTSGPPFFLPGAGPEGVHFTLKAGEQRRFDVGFKPTATGRQTGRLTVARNDGAQSMLGMPLFGTGMK
jgi:hypothetical protein